MLITLLLQLAAAEGAADRLLAQHRLLTTVAVRCPERSDPDEVVVCGRRRADHFRLPLEVVPDAGDPRHEGVPAERERLQGKTNNCQEMRYFLVGCGMVGVGVSTGAGGTRILTARPLSP